MVQFNINSYNENMYKEMTFEDGLIFIAENKGVKLYSDGLEFNEYMIYIGDHYEYEDGCFLGRYSDEIINRTGGNGSWIPKHKFYIDVIQDEGVVNDK